MISGNSCKLVSLADFIGNLQKKPRYIRLQIMWVGVAFCMIFVLGFWFWSLNDLLTAKNEQGSDDKKIMQGLDQVKKDMPTLWGSLGAGIENIVDSINSPASESSSPTPSEQPVIDDKLPIE